MEGDALCSIGELARRTGLTVKTIRYYSDRGIVAPAGRTPAGYRRYGADAATRLALVRTLRELGLGLDAIRRVVDRELTLGEVAAQHAAALDARIGVLRVRRAVLRAAVARGSRPEEIERMHRLAQLTESGRLRLIDGFLDAVLTDDRAPARHAAARRSMTPELPTDPTEEQVEAWVELAELSQDPDFRAGLRRAAEDHASDVPDTPADASAPPHPGVVAIVRDHATAAVDSGIAPESPEADRVVAALTAHCASALGRPDDGGLRRLLLQRLTTAHDPRRDRYLRLLALINDWPSPQPLAPALQWSVTALGKRAAG
ncbi:MerR family transcriptional regulator [Streptomyces sp. NRRL F-5126]|uniref:MerR family transcriptional regulator n=1 Tax=Streptomyces sp. NRRL F-5126 TaxID=1463857 RepID=UPI0004C6B11F|nr:MerR family transcriptional regulator [Streptomyces sp. NRRL F-5126]